MTIVLAVGLREGQIEIYPKFIIWAGIKLTLHLHISNGKRHLAPNRRIYHYFVLTTHIEII